MSTRTDTFRRLRGRLELSTVAVALVALALPDCSVDRGGLRRPSFTVYKTAATILTGEGVTIRVTDDDALLAGSEPRAFFADEEDGGAMAATDRVRADWKRFLLQRLSDPAASPEARATFGPGPWCAVDTEVTRTEFTMSGALLPEIAGPEIAGCTGAMVGAASDCPMVDTAMPMLGVDPPSVAFPPTPVGTVSPEQIVTISNAGTGRICLAMPALDLGESDHPEHFRVDATDCRNAGRPREIELDRTFLGHDRPSCQVHVRFAPTGATVGVGRIRLSTNDPARPVTFVDLTGTAQPGRLRPLAPVCFNTDEDPPGDPMCPGRVIRLLNAGPVGLVTIRSVSLAGGVDGRGWSLGPLTLPVTLPVDAVLPVTVSACAGATEENVLTVASNGAEPVFSVRLLPPGSGCVPEMP